MTNKLVKEAPYHPGYEDVGFKNEISANELANELKKMFVGEEYDRLVHEIPDLLRQQADLIRNLQKSLGFKNSGYETINLTPQLELTDEEIQELAEYHGIDSLYETGRIDFARAILRKAQEK